MKNVASHLTNLTDQEVLPQPQVPLTVTNREVVFGLDTQEVSQLQLNFIKRLPSKERYRFVHNKNRLWLPSNKTKRHRDHVKHRISHIMLLLYACLFLHKNNVTVTAFDAKIHASKCRMSYIIFFLLSPKHYNSVSFLIEVLFFHCISVSRRVHGKERMQRF